MCESTSDLAREEIFYSLEKEVKEKGIDAEYPVDHDIVFGIYKPIKDFTYTELESTYSTADGIIKEVIGSMIDERLFHHNYGGDF